MSKTTILPMPKVIKRAINNTVYKEAILLGSSPLQASILSSRPLPNHVKLGDVLNPSLSLIPDIEKMKDINRAADRISDAIIRGETIGLLCDFDVDGISSCAVLTKALTDYFNVPPILVKQVISNRMTEGYGFSQSVLDRVLDMPEIPTLLITADQGSSDGARIKQFLKEMQDRGLNNFDVVVTDHHEIPKNGGPNDAYAFVNPQQKGDEFPDKTICGCTVALFVMVQTRLSLIDKGYLSSDSPKLSELLSYSTSATIADCVSMASPTNRAIVSHGLKEINEEKTSPWRVMKKSIVNDKSQPFRAENVGFGLGPRINACSRTGGDGLIAVRYYLSETDMDAQRYFDMLDYNNEDRKKIEKKLVNEAIKKATILVNKGYMSLVIFLPNGHHGIHGIVASRVVEKFGRPVICLSPKKTEENFYIENFPIDIPQVERITGKTFGDMKSIRGTMKHPKNNKFTFIITKKENYKELSGVDRIEAIHQSQKLFSKDETFKILQEKMNIKTTKKLENFYLIDDFNYVKVEKKNKTDYSILVGEILLLSGSGRSIDGILTEQGKEFFDLHRALCDMDKKDSTIFAGCGYGGHTMAAGMSLPATSMYSLISMFEIETREQLQEKDVGPKIFIDGELPYDKINLDLVDEILRLEPYGRAFEQPSFALTAYISKLEIVGKNNDTGKLSINYNGVEYIAIWFGFTGVPNYKEIKSGMRCRFIVRVTDNFFRGNRTVSLQVSHAVPF